MALPFKWEFPGGKVNPKETPQTALRREVQEELGLVIDVGGFLAEGTVRQADRTIRLEVFLSRIVGGTLQLLEHEQVRWCGRRQLAGLDWAKADLPAVCALEEWFARRQL